MNPALGLIFGPAYDLTNVDGFAAWRSLALGGLLAGLGAIFAVTRATRLQEDSGQAELLASGVMGRSSRLLTAAGIALIGSLVLGIVAATITIVFGGDPQASLLLGATFTATGWMFAGVAAVTAQIGSDARTSNSLAVGVLGVLFVLRGFTYSVDAPAWTTWVNPLGWMTATKPANGNYWWPLLLAIVFAVLTLIAGFLLQGRRDFGQGLISPTPGPARGSDHSTWRLALRLNRGQFATWAVAFVALGAIFGFFATSLTDVLTADSAVQQILAAGATTPEELGSAFVVTILSLIGIIASIVGVQTMLRVRKEEMEDRVEPLLATAASRARYYASNVLAALGASSVSVVIAGLLVAVFASQADIGVTFSDGLLQTLATIPAVWTVVGVSVAIVGARPKVQLAAWFGVVLSFVLTLLGPTFKLPDWALAISPFWHVPNVAAANDSAVGLLAVVLVGALLAGVGFAGFRRRDMAR